MKRIHEVKLPTGLLTVKEDQTSIVDLLSICQFGARNNANRGFLFVSSELGKHMPSVPSEMCLSHQYLARHIEPSGHPVIFIGMAETAVGLGYGVFDAWMESHPSRAAVFLHTTRYQMEDTDVLAFEESHSHAPNQVIHKPKDDDIVQLMAAARTLVLVDDEASTGKTFVNLWNVLRTQCPMISAVNILTLTNFMSKQARESLSESMGVPVRFIQAVSGSWSFKPDITFHCASHGHTTTANDPLKTQANKTQAKVLSGAGRSGISRRMIIPDGVWEAVRMVIDKDLSCRIRIIGTGEFMHGPFVLGRALERLGHSVTIQSTTRSPVLEFGPIESTLRLTDPYGKGDTYFLYNARRSGKDEVTLVLHEMSCNEAITDLAAKLDGTAIHWDMQ